MKTMQKLEVFVQDIDVKTKAVLCDLAGIVTVVSGVMQQLVDFKKSYGFYDSGLISEKIKSDRNTDLCSLQNLKLAVEYLTDSVIRALAVAGAKLDMIRNEVLIARTSFSELSSAKELFSATDSLVEKLDWICTSIAKNIDHILTTMKFFENK